MPKEDQPVCRFDDFMQRALHDPETGYYARTINTVGATGDFSTTATLSDVLGKAIAHTALDWQKKHNTPLNLIEIGGGDGSLASSVIKSFPVLKRWKLSYHLVDSSAPLTKKQQGLPYLSKKVTWHTEMKSALNSCNGVAFIFSNELVDAFPVRVFRQLKSSKGVFDWQELYIQDGIEIFKTIEHTLPESTGFKTINSWQDQRIEIHQSYREWLTSWLPHWKNGQMLTIDYGDIHPDIYYRMPSGTLRAYAHHQRIIGNAVYQYPGKQDITTDVNFSDLIKWGEHENLTKVSLTNQAEFLKQHASDSPEDQFLIHPAGAGTAFKVLLQQRD